MSIQSRLKILMDILNLNIKDFSEKTGIPYRTLQNYLLGLREPTVSNLTKIATHLGININWLLTGEGELFIQKSSIDSRRQAIIQLILDMPEDKLDDIYKMLEKEKLLLELLEERKKLKNTG